MNKRVITTMAVIGGLAGSYAPILFGDTSFFDGWQILGGTIGGIIGIWLGVIISKRF